MKIKNGINLYNFAKKIIPGGTTLFQRDRNFTCQINGLLILLKQKKYMFGI